jgi:hypothetical protein
LLVWGRVSAGEVILEPAFEVVARPASPQRNGPHRVEALAADGATLFSYAFDGEAVDHGSPENRHFAFVIPTSVLRGKSIATLRLRGNGRTADQRSAESAQGLALVDSESPRVRRTRGRMAEVSWSAPSVRGVLVRDARTGDVLSLARGRGAQFEAGAGDVELIVSDGVRSHVRRAAVR